MLSFYSANKHGSTAFCWFDRLQFHFQLRNEGIFRKNQDIERGRVLPSPFGMAFLMPQMPKKTKNYFFALEAAKRPFGPAKAKSSRRVLRTTRRLQPYGFVRSLSLFSDSLPLDVDGDGNSRKMAKPNCTQEWTFLLLEDKQTSDWRSSSWESHSMCLASTYGPSTATERRPWGMPAGQNCGAPANVA